MSVTPTYGESITSALCNRDTLMKMIGDLDKRLISRVSSKVRRFAWRYDRQTKTNETASIGRCFNATDLAEAFSPPRMTEMVQTRSMVAGFALCITTCDNEGVPWDLSKTAMQQNTFEFVLIV